MISAAKLFSGAATDFGAEPNTQVSFVDAAFPGMLPVINRECVAQAVRTGPRPERAHQPGQPVRSQELLLCRSARRLSDQPVPAPDRRRRARSRSSLPTAARKTIGITRLHLEQDAGKSLHDQHPTKSYIDLNRAGVALMEIVSEPDICAPGGSRRLSAQAAHHPALPRHLRRQHGGRLHARRRRTCRCASTASRTARAAR